MSAAPPSLPPPWIALAARLTELAGACEARGEHAAAGELKTVLDDWWTQQQGWDRAAVETLAAHHDINNALVGVRGNAQLLMMNPIAQTPSVRDRLEVMLRESSRIQEAAGRLRSLRASLGHAIPDSHAA